MEKDMIIIKDSIFTEQQLVEFRKTIQIKSRYLDKDIEKDMIVTKDNIFTEEQLAEFRKSINTNNNDIPDDYAGDTISLKEGEGNFLKDQEHSNKIICKKLLQTASEYFDLSTLYCYDYWTHFNTRPIEAHIDKDETAYVFKNIDRYPICSIVFYLTVDNCKGGELVFDDVIVTPKENRLVLFKPGLMHGVNDFTGSRTSLNINPWATKIYSQ